MLVGQGWHATLASNFKEDNVVQTVSHPGFNVIPLWFQN